MNSTYPRPILYLGDTSLTTAASYLAGVMAAHQLGFDYVPSDRKPTRELLDTPRRLFILSDYESKMLSHDAQIMIVEQVRQGAGLMMIGGWESFHGATGLWRNTPIDQILPVDVPDADDRVNCDQPALVTPAAPHEITDGLPFSAHPPCVGGFNRLHPSDDTQTLLKVTRFAAKAEAGTFTFTPVDESPLLVVRQFVKGRTAALAMDVAPHWVGGLVDWGPNRLHGHAEGSIPIEVGSWYADFLIRLLTWTGRLDEEV